LNFIPHTKEDIARALEAIGAKSVDALFADIPERLRDPELDIPAGLDETALLEHLQALAAKNSSGGPSFLGGGVQRHFIPSVTPHLAMQSEFVTAYTPYQPEVAQGLLQATFEFQTMMCELTGLDVSNASMYDGASSVAEAALLAMRATRRSKVLVSKGLHPESREVLATYLQALEATVEEIALGGLVTGELDVSEDVACVIVQNPNFLGYLEAMPRFAEAAHGAGALFVAVVDPLSLAVLKAPGDYGADIAVGDGQTLGNPPNFGGPSFGFMVVKDALVRQLPGRLVGETKDVDGKRAFVLTLQAREQHIRRSKAKSNICSNHQLMALMAAVNMAALGPTGLREMAAASVQNAHKLASALAGAGFAVRDDSRFFNEFALNVAAPATTVRARLAEAGVHAGVPVPASFGLGEAVVLAATELTTAKDIRRLVESLQDVAPARPPMRQLEETAHD
jgi:glycine dehydrogenase subunit 1